MQWLLETNLPMRSAIQVFGVLEFMFGEDLLDIFNRNRKLKLVGIIQKHKSSSIRYQIWFNNDFILRFCWNDERVVFFYWSRRFQILLIDKCSTPRSTTMALQLIFYPQLASAHSVSAPVSIFGSVSCSKLFLLLFFSWHLGLAWLLTRQFHNLGHSTLRA